MTVSQKLFLSIILTTLTNPLISQDNYVQKTIALHANKYINIYANTKNVSNLGYGNCDFLHNGEELVVSTFIKKNDIVIDAGAHIGGWTKSVLEATKSECTIYAFEPVPDSYKQLESLKNKFNNHKTFIFNIALGKTETELTMNYFFQRGSDCSTLFNRPILHDVPVKKIRVPVTYLDKFAYEQGITHIHFLKIDTEGAELDVLMGARHLIENDQIDIIQFEYGGTYPDANITLEEVYSYLTSNQYLIFRIIPNGLIHIEAWNEALENFTYSNYLALKKAI